VAKLSLFTIAGMTEEEAREVFESVRWPNGPVCPHCGSPRAYKLEGKATRPGVFKCNICREQFTVTVGTVMHGTRIPLKKWLVAMYMMISGRKGIPAIQIWRDLELGSYKTAWFLLQRIRKAMDEDEIMVSLKGIVEVDETYVGGKGHRRGRGSEKKAVMMVMVERNGKAVAKHIGHANTEDLQNEMFEYIDSSATLMTDEWKSYIGLGEHYEGGHFVIKHKDHQYVDGILYTNTAECFFSLVKRSYKGIYHYISHKHLSRYADEFMFRWNHRKQEVTDALVCLIRDVGGKRLTQNALVAGIY
jgi:transposase-like protein